MSAVPAAVVTANSRREWKRINRIYLAVIGMSLALAVLSAVLLYVDVDSEP